MTETTPQIDPSQLRTDLLDDDGVGVLEVEGEIDVATVEQLERALNDAVAVTRGTLILDATGVDFIDSTGLRSILSAIAALTEQQRALALVCVAGPVKRLIELTALTGRLAIFEARADAIEHARAAAGG